MSTYDSSEPRSNFGLYVLLAFIAAALLAIGAYVFQRQSEDQSRGGDPQDPLEDLVATKSSAEGSDQVTADTGSGSTEPSNSNSGDPLTGMADVPTPGLPAVPLTPEQMLEGAGLGTAVSNPETLMKKMSLALETPNLSQLAALVGSEALNAEQLKRLEALTGEGYRPSSQNPIVEIGELEANRRTRWAVNLEQGAGLALGEESSLPQKTRVFVERVRGSGRSWVVGKMMVPELVPAGQAALPGMEEADSKDSLGVTHNFLQAALAQNFDRAKAFVDPAKVTDAKIAGLCIIFEEAKYKLRDKKPVRAMFNREFTAGFIAHVEDESGQKAADFGMNVERASEDDPWRVSEVNLDSLLADYATRVAGGDVHFTPLAKNPAGGDTLILYFGFDEDGLTPRTERQLDIVANLLKVDAKKKLTLSGHTDALGTDNYNDVLSGKRASAVERYLLSVGVAPVQIVTLAEGEAKPRLPNAMDYGQDNPTGRRANRRTEIYLDF